MSDPTPENIGTITALSVSVTAFLIIVYRKSGVWIKGLFTPIYGVAKTLLTLKEGHDRNEKTLADHELRLRGVEWIKSELDTVHERINDHEQRIREDRQRLSEGENMQENFERQINDLHESHKAINHHLNQLSRDVGAMGGQMNSLDGKVDKTSGQLDILISHLLPPVQQRKKN